MKQTSRRFVSMILALAFLVGALIVLFDLIQPAYGTLQEKKGRQVNAEILLENEQNVVNQAKKLLAQYESASQAQSNLALAMPSGPSVANALAQVYGIAENVGITVTNITISPPAATPRQGQAQGQAQAQAQEAGGGNTLNASQIVKPLGTFSLQLKTRGTYENFKNFLSQVETNIRIFDVTAISIQQSAPTGGTLSGPQNLLSYDVTVSTYYQLP